MNAPNLVQELGAGYVQERFYHSMFLDEQKRPAYLTQQGWTREKARVAFINGSADKPVIEEGLLPFSFFTDMTVFGTPPLGWRMAADGRYLAHFRRNNRSYHRGTAPHNITRYVSPATRFLMDTENLSYSHFDGQGPTTRMIMVPEYVSLRAGVDAMKHGDLFSFAVSPTLAVIPEVGERQAIYFNQNKVAVVEPDGQIKCDSPAILDIIKDHE